VSTRQAAVCWLGGARRTSGHRDSDWPGIHDRGRWTVTTAIPAGPGSKGLWCAGRGASACPVLTSIAGDSGCHLGSHSSTQALSLPA
jgi:hypothetical protein